PCGVASSVFVINTRVVKWPSRADVYIVFRRARGVSGPSVFNSPRHQAPSKKSRSSSGEVGGCISCDQRRVILSIGSLSLQMGSIAPRRLCTKVRRGKSERSRTLSGCRPYPRRFAYHLL